MSTITVDIWTDVVCPWCHIGKRRFDRALAAFEHRDDVRVRWRSFELDPTGEYDGALTIPETLTRRGMTRAQADEALRHVTNLAAEVGLDYRLHEARPVRSFDAHRLTHHAETAGRGDAVRERLLRAFTAENAVISDHATLATIAAEAGLDRDEVLAMLASDRHADAVRADEDLARRVGVTGVPFFLFAGTHGVAGAQPVEVLRDLLTTAWHAAG